MDIPENVKNRSVWLRGLFIIIFGAVLYLVCAVTFFLVVFQFITKVATGGVNSRLSGFSAGLVRYIEQLLRYMTFLSDTRPFPFDDWPAAPAGGDAPAAPAAPAAPTAPRRRTKAAPRRVAAKKKEE